MPVSKLKKYLDQNQAAYFVLKHPLTYTAEETAFSAFLPGRDVAKTVIVRMDDKIAMVVIPASHKIDFDVLRSITGARTIGLVAEAELENLFPDCQIGAMPPFGNLYCLDVYIDKSLTEQDVMIFNAGNHWELIEMRYRDFERLVHPCVLNFALEIF